jgi:hypothetical protein
MHLPFVLGKPIEDLGMWAAYDFSNEPPFVRDQRRVVIKCGGTLPEADQLRAVLDDVRASSERAGRLLLEVLDGKHQISADLEGDIREWGRRGCWYAWARWLWHTGSRTRQVRCGDRDWDFWEGQGLPPIRAHRYENYAQVAATALLELESVMTLPPPAVTEEPQIPANEPPGPRLAKRKRSTERGDARAKLIAALTRHHRYADGSCLNLEPIGNNELARRAEVDQATASFFFRQKFNGHGKYKAACADASVLVAALRLLNGEFPPHLLYGGKPPDEAERDE